MKKLILTICLLLCLVGCLSKDEEVEIIIASDLHYLSPSLYDDGEIFHTLLENNDSKLIEYDQEILDELVKQVIAQKPDAFLLSGDITFNGEMVSLLEVKEKLLEIEEAGIDVLVIPGNHDISYPYACSYLGDKLEHVEDISQKQFLEVMQEFGYQQAIEKDEASFSYIYPISKKHWILALDANTEGNIGKVLPSTLEWLENALNQAKKQDIEVTVMSHQNVLRQNEIIYVGYLLSNSVEVESLLRKYDVKLVLSGHSHIQHTTEVSGLVDICNESIVVTPLSYAIVQRKGKEFTYQRKSLGILEQEADDRFFENTNQNIEKFFNTNDVPSEVQDDMLAYAQEFNKANFMDDQNKLKQLFKDPRYEIWQVYGEGSFWLEYMKTALENMKKS